MSKRFPSRPGIRRVRSALALAACSLLLSGCLYSFTGGGLPRHIRTIAVVPFENGTAEPVLSTDVTQQLQTQIPRKLGVRLADQRVADAVLRGRITRYEETVPAFRPGAPGTPGGVQVVQREIQMTFEAEIYDLREDRPIWKQSGLAAIGRFRPDSEQSTAGRTRAIEELVQKVIEGAQSQW